MATCCGSFFGSSVCAVDLNADGLSDLLVGAPMETSSLATGVTREEGRVHVYINQGEAKLLELGFQLIGRDSYAARFGETIAKLGDLDDDGYPLGYGRDLHPRLTTLGANLHSHGSSLSWPHSGRMNSPLMSGQQSRCPSSTRLKTHLFKKHYSDPSS